MMDDMTAFERQLTAEFSDLMGPILPVDDAAILAAIRATRSPEWRFQTMFNATKLVAAGAVVALFGAFLVAGLQSQPRDDYQAPGASAPSSEPLANEQPWIAYQAWREGDGTWLIHPDGSGDHQVDADYSGNLILPDWSPDGERLVLASRGPGPTEPLYEYDLSSGTFRQLFPCEEPCLGDDEPVYSPDGTTVAFIRALGPVVDDLPSDCGLWMGDLATGEVSQVTSNPGCDREYLPRWSPDGTQLTYMRIQWTKETGTTGTAVFVIDADGTNERQLTDWETMAGEPDWSPDGEWIVYGTYPLGEFVMAMSNLYRIHPDGSGIEQLTFNEDTTQRATQPRYTPDGESIVFTAAVPAGREIWVMPADGGEPYVVAGEGYANTHGTWQPQG